MGGSGEGKVTGLQVVAEGIETEQEAEIMRGYRTAYGQGFYFSRPIDETAFIELLRGPRLEDVS